MDITITEPGTYEAYSSLVDEFQGRMRAEKHENQANFSDEREKGVANVRRFIAKNKNGMVVGWMTLKTQDSDLKIEGICADPNKLNSKGASKALVSKAVNCSLSSGKGGVVTLTNVSKGTGDCLYKFMGFEYVEGSKMRLEIDWREWDTKKVGERETKRGKNIDVVEIYRK